MRKLTSNLEQARDALQKGMSFTSIAVGFGVNIATQLAEELNDELQKHGDHDQSSHGNRGGSAGGGKSGAKSSSKQNEKPKAVKIEIEETDDDDEDFISDNEPSSTIKTGSKSSEGATELQVYRKGSGENAVTLVSPVGEEYNGDNWKIKGDVSDEDILAQYNDAMKEFD